MVLLALGAAVGCYHHDLPRDPVKARVRPPLVQPMSGVYDIVRGGRSLGEERFTITSSASTWKLTGEVQYTGPAEVTHGYTFEVDERSAEPEAFEVFIDILGERRTVRAHRDDEGFFEVAAGGIGGPYARRIPYAPGTAVHFASPLFETLVLALLVPSLDLGEAVSVRTVEVPVPRLEPVVELQTYTLEGHRDGLALVKHQAADAPPRALWVRKDGLPVRVRAWPHGAGEPPVEWRLR